LQSKILKENPPFLTLTQKSVNDFSKLESSENALRIFFSLPLPVVSAYCPGVFHIEAPFHVGYASSFLPVF
jgi:hypothetical protein